MTPATRNETEEAPAPPPGLTPTLVSAVGLIQQGVTANVGNILAASTGGPSVAQIVLSDTQSDIATAVGLGLAAAPIPANATGVELTIDTEAVDALTEQTENVSLSSGALGLIGGSSTAVTVLSGVQSNPILMEAPELLASAATALTETVAPAVLESAQVLGLDTDGTGAQLAEIWLGTL